VAYLLICQIQAFSIVDRTLYGEWLGKPGDKLTQIINISAIAISIVLFGRGLKYWPRLQRGGLISISVAVLLLCSAAWSVNPGATISGGIQYFFLVIAAVGVAENLESDDFMDLLAWVCFLSAIASLVLLVVSPASAFGEGGDFRGIFSQKNPCGQAMLIGALASLHRLRVGKRSRLLTLIMLFVIIFVALKSESMTSLLAIFLFVGLGLALQFLRKAAIIILAPVALIAAFNWASLSEMLGKTTTLTGRTDIWAYVIPYMYQRPMLGWGYGAFWSTNNPVAWIIANELHWYAPEAHNGILEILLSVGLIGLVLFIYLWGRTVSLSLECMRTSESAMAITCFLMCAGVVVVGVAETVLLYCEGITCVFLITGFFCERAITTATGRRRVSLPVVVHAVTVFVPPPARACILSKNAQSTGNSEAHWTWWFELYLIVVVLLIMIYYRLFF
jgi:O-antigen ligase